MPILMATRDQLAAIHVLKGKAGLDEDTYRDFLAKHAGQRSAKLLSRASAGTVIERLRDLAGDATKPKGAVAGLDTPLAGKLRALWIAGYNLGLVRDRTDRAMLAFLERQTGVSHTRFLSEAGQGTKAVEGLKAWLARDGGVRWPDGKQDGDALESRRAVLDAQWARLVALPRSVVSGGLFEFSRKVTGKTYLETLDADDLDAVQAALGRKLRYDLMAEAALAGTGNGDAA